MTHRLNYKALRLHYENVFSPQQQNKHLLRKNEPQPVNKTQSRNFRSTMPTRFRLTFVEPPQIRFNHHPPKNNRRTCSFVYAQRSRKQSRSSRYSRRDVLNATEPRMFAGANWGDTFFVRWFGSSVLAPSASRRSVSFWFLDDEALSRPNLIIADGRRRRQRHVGRGGGRRWRSDGIVV